MSTVREFHDKAMSLAQQALVARTQGKLETAIELARQAYYLEAQAAELVPEDPKSEPTRSILYRSAASLAYQCHEHEIAQRLIAKGLSGYPPSQVERELKDLYEQVNFEAHLETRGVILEDTDLQLSLQGLAVGSGMVLYNEFIDRISKMRTLLNRTMQRLSGKEYTRSRSVAKATVPFTPALSAPRPGSFAITIRLTYLENQQMTLLFTAAQVIDELLTSIELLTCTENDALRQRMQSEGYYNHFVSLARDIAPDGKRINYVGFTSRDRRIGMTTQRSDIELPVADELEASEERLPIRAIGILDLASVRDTERMGITAEDGTKYDLIVREGFDDLLFSYWRQRVVVIGTVTGTRIFLSDISAADD